MMVATQASLSARQAPIRGVQAEPCWSCGAHNDDNKTLPGGRFCASCDEQGKLEAAFELWDDLGGGD